MTLFVISVSPACGIELVEVVGSRRVGVDLLVEVLLPGMEGGEGRKRKRAGEMYYYIRTCR